MGLFSKKKTTIPEPKEKAEETTAIAAPSASVPKGGDANSYRTVIGPHITEKAALGNERGSYVFRVARDANKTEIKKSVEALYKVKVQNVRVVSVPAKKRQVGRYLGEKSAYKKAIVSLKAGDKIDMVNA